jgi:hypothetical protein
MQKSLTRLNLGNPQVTQNFELKYSNLWPKVLTFLSKLTNLHNF